MRRFFQVALMTFVISAFASTAMAKPKTAKFNVNGRCARCGVKIEAAAKAVDGVKTAEWDEVSKEMVVTFDSHKTSKKQIQKAIAAVGFTAGKIAPEPGKEKKHDAKCTDNCKD